MSRIVSIIVKLFKFIIEGNRTKWRTIQEIIGRVISKSDEQAQGELYKVLRFFSLNKICKFYFYSNFFLFTFVKLFWSLAPYHCIQMYCVSV